MTENLVILRSNNISQLNTFNGQAPIVIGHRGGGTGYRPEHTVGNFGGDLIGSHDLGIKFGADYIEPDLVVTKDGVLIVRHEPLLATVKTDNNGNIIYGERGKPIIQEANTSIADFPEFASRLTTKVLDRNRVTGWFAEDFTLAEIKKLRAIERLPLIRPDNTWYNYLFQIPTFNEVINLAKECELKLVGKLVSILKPNTLHTLLKSAVI